ncbi:MAG: diacylglycerol kinase family protein [Bacteroidetes bacterium]|nr:MAG: diacylglycerol kinase family protein [Bacteroidota bacterium]
MFSFLAGRIRSFGYAIRGIFTLFRTQKNAQVHLLAVVLVSLVAALLHVSATEWCLLLICMGQVLLAEGANTALEFLCDKVSPEYDPLIGKAKDVAAGAVLLSVIFCALVWAIIHVPKIWALLYST